MKAIIALAIALAAVGILYGAAHSPHSLFGPAPAGWHHVGGHHHGGHGGCWR